MLSPPAPETSAEPHTPPRAERGYGWLGLVLPADARRFRASDAALAAELDAAGAELVEAAPDVEVGSIRELEGDASVAIALLGHPPAPLRLPRRAGGVWRELPLPLRVTRRLADSVRVRLTTPRTRRLMRRLGYANVRSLYWDHDMAAPRASQGRGRLAARMRAFLSRRALVIGEGPSRRPTLLDEALATARHETGLALKPSMPFVREDLALVDAGPGLLRLAVGCGRDRIRRQRESLALLHAGGLPLPVSECIPWELAAGSCGIAEWTLERRLSGMGARPPIEGALLSQCVAFLAALFCAQTSTAVGTLLEQADLIADARPDTGRRVHALAERLETLLGDLPRGLGHGDFFHGNLLVDGDKLVGVIDWEAAGPRHLPLLDLLHLRVSTTWDVADADWSRLLTRELFPWARRGGGEIVRDYCERTLLTIAREQLPALVCAYWLAYVSRQLRIRPYRATDPLWMERNVLSGLEAAGASL